MGNLITQMMQAALAQAQAAAWAGEVPVGAVIYREADGQVLAQTHNLVEAQNNPTAHAEMLAIAQALKGAGTKYLEDCTLVVTLEPCAMCAQAASHARVGKVVFGAYDPKSGGTVNGARVPAHAHFKPEVLGGIEEEACRALLQNFFKTMRA